MKKRIVFTWILLFVLVFFIQSTTQAKGEIALMYAFDQEGALLRSKLSLKDSIFVKGRVFWIGKLEGKEVVIVNSGVGMTNAAMTTQLLIDKYNPEEIIFTGNCGGI